MNFQNKHVRLAIMVVVIVGAGLFLMTFMTACNPLAPGQVKKVQDAIDSIEVTPTDIKPVETG